MRTIAYSILIVSLFCILTLVSSAEQYRLTAKGTQHWHTASWQVLRQGNWEPSTHYPGTADDILIDGDETGGVVALHMQGSWTVRSLRVGTNSPVRLTLVSGDRFRIDGDLHIGTASTVLLPWGTDEGGAQRGTLSLGGSLRMDHGALIDAPEGLGFSCRLVLESGAPNVQTVSMPTVTVNPFPLEASGVARISSRVRLDVVDATPDYAHASEALLLNGDLVCDGGIVLSGRSLDLGDHNVWLGAGGSIESDSYHRFGVFSSAVFESAGMYGQGATTASPMGRVKFTGTVRREITAATNAVELPLAASALFTPCPITLTPQGRVGASAYVAVRLVTSRHPLASEGADRYWVLLSEGLDDASFTVHARMDRQLQANMHTTLWNHTERRWEHAGPVHSDGLTLDIASCGTQVDITAQAAMPTPIDMLTSAATGFETAYPNPVRSASMLRISLGRRQNAGIIVVDAAGRTVATPAKKMILGAGTHDFRFDAAALPSGVYHAILTTSDGIFLQRLLVTR